MSDIKQEYTMQGPNPQTITQAQLPFQQQGLPVYNPQSGGQQYPGTPGSIPQNAPILVYPQPGVPSNPVAAGQAYRDQLFAQCAKGIHERKREYGMFGIVTAVCCFPLGLICLFADSTERCSRCGISLDAK